MKRLCQILAASSVLMLATAPPVPALGGGNDPVAGQREVDLVYYVQGTVTTPFGTFAVDLKVTTCKQGTSGCKPD